jgi:peptide deformylase
MVPLQPLHGLTAGRRARGRGHLNGILFLQHISALKRELIKRKIRKLRKKGEWD